MVGIGVERLRRLPIWAQLDDRLLAVIAAKLHYLQLAAGRNVFTQHDDNDDAFLVLSGHLRMRTYSVAGREVIFHDLHPGDLVGVVAAVDGLPRSTNLTAVTDVELASLDAAQFKKLVLEHPEFAMAAIRNLCRVIRTLNDRILLLTSPVASRVYAELLRLATAQRIENNRGRIAPAPKHVDIAHQINTQREAVTRTLSSLQRQKIVQREKGALVILDVAALRRLAEGSHQH